MELIYEDDRIRDVSINVQTLQTKLTLAEKLEFFACDHPNQPVWQHIGWLEQNAKNDDGTPKTTLQETVSLMVTENLITLERATEILS